MRWPKRSRGMFALGITNMGETDPWGNCGFALDAARRMIKTEDYPLTAPMFLYFPARRLPLITREFLAFTRGPSAQIVIRRAGLWIKRPRKSRLRNRASFANAIIAAGAETPLEGVQRMTATLVPMAGSPPLPLRGRSIG